MPTPIWPIGLPQFVLQDGYEEKLPDQTIETPMDSGPGKSRRRSTTGFRSFSVQIKMTDAQVANFETFYDSTLSAGTVSFDWVHPRYQTAMRFRFRKPPPSYAPIGGGNTIVSFRLESVPS